jgi:alpha-N-arabinofuranosidase
LEAIDELKPPIIRWPGGCFASPYRWKDGIGSQDKRKVYPREIWDDLEINAYGTDEFINMCKQVGAEPLIVVNIGTENWNEDPDPEEFMQDVLDWIEYCNGPATSKWGKIRTQNGHREPYNVKYWEIDNETWHMGVDDYIEAVKKFAPVMKKADPNIKLAACGSGGFDLEWNRRMIEECAELIDYLSIHHYEDPDQFAKGPYNYEGFIRQTGNLISKSKNPNLKIYCSEWNAQSTDWRTGLYAGGVLNAFERCGDIFEIGGPALFLRHTSATAWNNAFINFDHSSWFPAPNYVVMKFWREHFAPLRIGTEGDLEALNLIATKSQDGKLLYVKAVNSSDKEIEVNLSIGQDYQFKNATMKVVAPGSLEARNTLEKPNAVRPVQGILERNGQQLKFKLAPLSAAVVTIES